jgi:hypothetical protein
MNRVGRFPKQNMGGVANGQFITLNWSREPPDSLERFNVGQGMDGLESKPDGTWADWQRSCVAVSKARTVELLSELHERWDPDCQQWDKVWTDVYVLLLRSRPGKEGLVDLHPDTCF